MSQARKDAPRRGQNLGGGPMGGGMIPTEKAKDLKGALKKLFSYLGKYRFALLLVCVLSLISTIMSIFGPKILGNATDELVTGLMAEISGTGSVDFESIGRILLWLIGLYVTSALLAYVQNFMMTGVISHSSYRLRRDIGHKIHALPFGYYDSVTHGEILSRITNDVDTISQNLGQNLTQLISSVTMIVGIPVMMLTISWRLTLVALAVIPLSTLAVMRIVKKSQNHFVNQQEYLGKVNGHVEEMLGSHVVVKAFNGEDTSVAQFDEYNNTLYKSAWKANFLSGLMMPITIFIGNLAYVAVCILGGYFATAGKVTIGGIQSFIQYLRMFTQPIAQIAQISNILQQTAASAERVFDFLDQTEEPPDAPNALTVNRQGAAAISNGGTTQVQGQVTFANVAFGYSPDKEIIHNFSATVHPGQKIAIVGPTGAGKTTIVKLLMRFYDINSGSIQVDGHNITRFERDGLRSLFGMVLQDTWLFNGTIADNIRYGKLDATDQEVREAAIAAQADHFVRTLPDGYQMILNEEADNISQGQKQLLTIARAILANPEILILDEATSSVDTRTEILIQKAMDTLMKGRTSFVIAHRLSTIRNADLILVMKDGDIIEQGKHEQLLSQNGFYADLYNSQFDHAV